MGWFVQNITIFTQHEGLVSSLVKMMKVRSTSAATLLGASTLKRYSMRHFAVPCESRFPLYRPAVPWGLIGVRML